VRWTKKDPRWWRMWFAIFPLPLGEYRWDKEDARTEMVWLEWVEMRWAGASDRKAYWVLTDRWEYRIPQLAATTLEPIDADHDA
jgi:hypothetical protein